MCETLVIELVRDIILKQRPYTEAETEEEVAKEEMKLPFKVLRCQNEHCKEKATYTVAGGKGLFCDKHYMLFQRLLNAELIKHGILRK